MPDLQAPARSLRLLSEELGGPSAAQLWLAVKQRGLMFSKKVVEAFVKEKGKTVSESIDARWQMDLISFVNQPVVVGGKTFKWILVCINTFDRYL